MLDKANGSLAATSVPSGTVEATPVKTADLDVGVGLSGAIRIVNGGTGPTTEARAQVKVQAKGSGTWEIWVGPLVAGKDAGGVSTWSFTVPPEFDKARVEFFGNQGAAVTASAEIGRLNSF